MAQNVVDCYVLNLPSLLPPGHVTQNSFISDNWKEFHVPEVFSTLLFFPNQQNAGNNEKRLGTPSRKHNKSKSEVVEENFKKEHIFENESDPEAEKAKAKNTQCIS